MTDASFRGAGYAFMVEYKPDQKIQRKQKTYATVVFGSKFFFSRATQNVHLFGRSFSNVHGVSRAGKYFMGNNKANDRFNR